jgi:hypothetical protein
MIDFPFLRVAIFDVAKTAELASILVTQEISTPQNVHHLFRLSTNNIINIIEGQIDQVTLKSRANRDALILYVHIVIQDMEHNVNLRCDHDSKTEQYRDRWKDSVAVSDPLMGGF